MSDLQCPVRVHLVGPGAAGPDGERVAAVLELEGATPEGVVEQVADAADLYRGEAVVVVLAADVRREVAVRLSGDPDARVLEGDADGWRAVR